MPGCNIFSQEHQMLLVHFFGTLSASDPERQATSVLSNPDFSESTKELISFTQVDDIAEDVDMERLAEVVKNNKSQIEKYPEIKIAIIAPDPSTFSLARAYQESVESHERKGEMKIFTSKHEAVQWLGGKASHWDLLLDRVSKMCEL